MDFASFEDFWTPHEGHDGRIVEYLDTVEPGLRPDMREVVRQAYLGGESDGPRSHAATAWGRSRVPFPRRPSGRLHERASRKRAIPVLGLGSGGTNIIDGWARPGSLGPTRQAAGIRESPNRPDASTGPGTGKRK